MSNEAAERLELWLSERTRNEPEALANFRWRVAEALAAERKVTVERIRAAVLAMPTHDVRKVPGGLHVLRSLLLAILLAETEEK